MIIDIAAEQFLLYGEDGRKPDEITLQVGVPFITGDGRAKCASAVTGLKDKSFEADGDDTLIALCSAIRFLKEWAISRAKSGGKLYYPCEDSADETCEASVGLIFNDLTLYSQREKKLFHKDDADSQGAQVEDDEETRRAHDELKQRRRAVADQPITSAIACSEFKAIQKSDREISSVVQVEKPGWLDNDTWVCRTTITEEFEKPKPIYGSDPFSALVYALWIGWFLIDASEKRGMRLVREKDGFRTEISAGQIYGGLFTPSGNTKKNCVPK